MKVQYCSDYGEMSRSGSDSIVADLREKPGQLICAATGNSPVGVYQNLAASYFDEKEVFKKLRIIKLDEWGGIPSTDPNSCETFIQEKILRPLHISSDRYIAFKSDPVSPRKECQRIQKEIRLNGPIDICILGLGKNGHIGFNEPAEALNSNCHMARLSHQSLQHAMANTMEIKPRYGLTLGMDDILQSKKIILLITGSNKQSVISKLLLKRITKQLPASFLWSHTNVECFIDSTAL
ncbi:galactosamine-6-phosphate isomerase [Pricia antarctica]|uniref:Galactosamine-6-phosphate isomerase n=1 Tax=Pricia antarctica TaxID=641691 RepID=A0A1G7FI01_9FLAO|nr:galactosamine-6-phosphate isomerase [Pricia antarctica]SDE75491.1 galactosamine-6-phosphate isomerase [Pricia antarctica]